jgi:hypothetical protein
LALPGLIAGTQLPIYDRYYSSFPGFSADAKAGICLEAATLMRNPTLCEKVFSERWRTFIRRERSLDVPANGGD